jgi:hypothetical protein
MTMIKKITAGFCLLALVCSAGGCRLAKEESGTAAKKDRLIGVLVTTKHLDLFDFEGYMKDNPARLSAGGGITLDGADGQYNGRLYAALSEAPASGTVGEGTGPADYVFEGIDGLRYFVVNVSMGEAGSCQTSISDPGISDGHVAVGTFDERDSIELEGTIYVSPATTGRAYYFNPVYQDAEGSVYVTSGAGCQYSSASGEGMAFSKSYTESHSETENGKEITSETSVTITVSVKNMPEKLVIVQMAEDHSVLARDEYAPGAAPGSITPHTSTAYIISEIYATDADGKTQTTRELYNKDAAFIRSFYDRGDGILIAQYTSLNLH